MRDGAKRKQSVTHLDLGVIGRNSIPYQAVGCPQSVIDVNVELRSSGATSRE